MQEKQMVNDALNSINSGLTSYASMIAQTENQELRNTLKQMRDQAEKSQYDLYQIAKGLNYYTPAQQASEQEIMKVKSEVCSGSQGSSSSNQGSVSSSSSSMGGSGSMSGAGSMNASSSMGSSGSMKASSSMSGASSMSGSNSMSGSASMNSSSNSAGIASDIDDEKRKALQAPPKSDTNSFR